MDIRMDIPQSVSANFAFMHFYLGVIIFQSLVLLQTGSYIEIVIAHVNIKISWEAKTKKTKVTS